MKSIVAFILKRTASGFLTLFVIVTAAFFLQRAAPGGPFDTEREMTAEAKAARIEEWRLDRPLFEQYLFFLEGLCAWPPDLKRSMKQPDFTVMELIGPRFAVSASLGLTVFIFSLLIAVPLGLVAALKKNTWIDYAAMTLALIGIAVPAFCLGPLLKWLFALKLGWLPESRWTGPASMVLPGLTLATGTIAATARLVRGGMIDVKEEDWMRTARAKGLPDRLIVFRHALRAALLPLASYLGPALAGLAVGSVVVERIFQIPGLGTIFVEGAFNRDYTVVMGAVIVYSAVLIALNVLADLLLYALDPRLRGRS